MSLLVAYFDKLRAVVASDDRAVVEENSTRTPLPGRFPKFRILKSAVLGAVVLGFVGRNDLAEKLWAGTERMMSGNPTMSFRDLAESLPQFTRIAFSKRQPLQIIEGDKLDGLLAGYDRAQGRMRVLVWRSEDDFHVVEPSQDPNARVLALGAFELSNEDALHRLTARMQRAGRMESSWIVDSLRFTVAKLHDMHPLVIGAPSFYAALDRSGSVELPAEFPPPDSESLLPSAVGARLYAGRFFVGSITTPAAGKPDTIGNDDGGAGAQSGQVNTHYLGNLGTFLAITPGGNGVKTNEPAMVDGSLNDHADFTVTGNSSAANTAASTFNFSQLSLIRHRGPMTVKILYDIPTNSLNGGGAQSLAVVGVAYTDSAGANQQAFPVSVPAGTTVGKGIASAVIPAGSSNFALNPSVQTRTIDTSGTLTLRVWEAWIETAD